MWRTRVVTAPVVERPLPPERTPLQQELAQLLLPRPPRTRSLASRLSFWARTNRASTTRAACFFQHVSATTWLRAS